MQSCPRPTDRRLDLALFDQSFDQLRLVERAPAQRDSKTLRRGRPVTDEASAEFLQRASGSAGRDGASSMTWVRDRTASSQFAVIEGSGT